MCKMSGLIIEQRITQDPLTLDDVGASPNTAHTGSLLGHV